MTDTTTPGQIAYAAYRQKFLAYQHHTSGTAMPEPWEILPLLVQICWETAATAVLEGCAMLCPSCGAELERCNAKETPCEPSSA